MTAKAQLAGVTDFLQAVYGPGTRLSALLTRAGYTEPQLALLRGQYLDDLLRAFVTAISLRIQPYHNGERKVFILVRRIGLDGQPRATLEDLATRLDISGERVRQVEASVIRRCRIGENRDYWPEALNSIARSLLIAAPDPGSHDANPPRETAQAGSFSSAQATMSSSVPTDDQRAAMSSEADGAPRLADLGTAVAAVLDATGEALTDNYVAKVLLGDRDPISDALVEVYELRTYHGLFAGEERQALQLRIHELRVSRARAVLDTDLLAHVVRTVVDAVGSGFSDFYLAAILGGEAGPTTAALVGHYRLEPILGAFGDVDRKALETLVREARATLPRDPAISEQARAAVAAVIERTDRRLRAEYIAKVLVGERGPVVEALVRRYALESFYGSCADVDREQLTALTRTLRPGGARAVHGSHRAGSVPGPSANEPSLDRVRDLIQAIQQRTGDLSFWVYAHILYGSKGPVVEGLVATHGLQEYGLLRDIGFGRVKHLVQEALRQPQARSRPAPPQLNGHPIEQVSASAPTMAQDAWSGSVGPALLQRLAECGEALPTVDDVRRFLDLRADNPTADTHARLDRWLHVHRGRAVASWLCLEDARAVSDALPCEIGAMCCQLAPLAAREVDLERKTRLSEVILSSVSAGMDHIGRIPIGADLEQLIAAFAALITHDDTLGVRDAWLKRLANEKERQSDKAPDSLWRRLLPSR